MWVCACVWKSSHCIWSLGLLLLGLVSIVSFGVISKNVKHFHVFMSSQKHVVGENWHGRANSSYAFFFNQKAQLLRQSMLHFSVYLTDKRFITEKDMSLWNRLHCRFHSFPRMRAWLTHSNAATFPKYIYIWSYTKSITLMAAHNLGQILWSLTQLMARFSQEMLMVRAQGWNRGHHSYINECQCFPAAS